MHDAVSERLLSNSLFFALWIAACLCSVAAPARAERFYMGLDAGRTWAPDTCTASLPNGVAGCSSKAVAARVVTGYEIDPTWSAELSYANYGTANLGTCLITGPCGTAGLTGLGYWSLSGYQLSGIAAWPLGGGVALTGKAGLAYTTMTGGAVTSNNLTPALGFGAQYDFDRRYRVRAQFEYLGTVGNAGTTRTKVEVATLGIVLLF